MTLSRPNFSLLLLFADAKEGFVSQFKRLESSAQLVELQLHNIGTAMNCSRVLEEEEEKEAPHRSCRALIISTTTVGGALRQLRQAAQTLDKMVRSPGCSDLIDQSNNSMGRIPSISGEKTQNCNANSAL